VDLVILIGLQASGKSTFARRHLAETHEHVSKDELRNSRSPARRQAELIEAALQVGRSVVVDNTNPTVEERAALLHQGRAYGARLVGHYFDSTVKDCLARNRQRTGRSRVPDVAIYATAKKLERPSYAEGFDSLFSVHMLAGEFEVSAWGRE